MFKLKEICEELSQVKIPMRADELESMRIMLKRRSPLMKRSVFGIAL